MSWYTLQAATENVLLKIQLNKGQLALEIQAPQGRQGIYLVLHPLQATILAKYLYNTAQQVPLSDLMKVGQIGDITIETAQPRQRTKTDH
ncbi:MAG: hypothetical protein ACRC7I_12270, partial [Selenomonadaceae bacterium]